MALDFPTSPALNQVYTFGSYSWSWDGTSWVGAVPIVNATINNTTIGAVTPSTGAFTTLSATTPIASSSGGTGNGFTKFSGPASSEKTFTLPNASSTLLYEGGTIGATTANTGAFTTLSATGDITASAGAFKLTDTYTLNWGNGNSYVQGSVAGGYVRIGAAGSVVGTFTSTGLNSTAIGATTASTGAFTTGTFSAGIDVTSPASVQAISIKNRASDNTYGGIYFFTNDGLTAQSIFQNQRVGTNGSQINILPKTDGGGNVTVATFSSTGLSVTALSATGGVSGTGFTGSAGNYILGTSGWGVLYNDATATVLRVQSGGTTALRVADTNIATATSTGLAVTGALSATGLISAVMAANGTGVSVQSTAESAGGSQPSFVFKNTAGATKSYMYCNVGAGDVALNIAGTDRLFIASTGIAVTGNTNTTGYLWAGSVSGGSTTAGDIQARRDATHGVYYFGDGNDKYLYYNGSSFDLTHGLAVVGALSCTGALSKGSGSFRIEHPLPAKSATHQLVHSFIEGPQADLIYRGKVVLVDGTASVNIDAVSTMTEGTFEVLCREVQCFTTNETGWTAVRGKVTGNILTIEAKDADCVDEISWMVIGERQDPHMMETDWTDDNGKVIVEPLKPSIEPIQNT